MKKNENLNSKEDFQKYLAQEINFLRKDPQTYASKIRKYIKFFTKEILMLPGMPPILTIEGSKAFEDAADFLDNFDPIPILKINESLNNISTDVIDSILLIKELEKLDTINVDKYIEKYGKIVGHFSQALDFGSCNPELVVMNLLVDDGDQSKTNRNTLLNPKFKLIGISTSSHGEFLYCTVITFARHFFELGKEVDVLSDDNYSENKENFRNFECRNEVVVEFEKKVRNMCVDVEDKNYDEEIDLPDGVIKIEKNEKVIEENGVKKKVKKIKKFKEDGCIETEIIKENFIY